MILKKILNYFKNKGVEAIGGKGTVALRVKTGNTGTSDTSTPVSFITSEIDTHSIWNGTNRATIKDPGIYFFYVTGYQTTGASTDVDLYINSAVATTMTNWDNTRTASGSTIANVSAGSTIDIRFSISKGWPNDGRHVHFGLNRLDI